MATFENPLGSESPTATFEDENDVEAGSWGGKVQSSLKKLGSRDAKHAHLEFTAGIHRGGHNVNEHFVGSGVLQAGAGLAAGVPDDLEVGEVFKGLKRHGFVVPVHLVCYVPSHANEAIESIITFCYH